MFKKIKNILILTLFAVCFSNSSLFTANKNLALATKQILSNLQKKYISVETTTKKILDEQSFITTISSLDQAELTEEQKQIKAKIKAYVNKSIYLYLKNKGKTELDIPEDYKKLENNQKLLNHLKQYYANFTITSNLYQSTKNDETSKNLNKIILHQGNGKDISLFDGKVKKSIPTLFEKIKKTQTLFGTLTLADMMANITPNTYKRNIPIIKELKENSKIYKQLNQKILEFKKLETDFLQLHNTLMQKLPNSDKIYLNYIIYEISKQESIFWKYFMSPLGHATKAGIDNVLNAVPNILFMSIMFYSMGFSPRNTIQDLLTLSSYSNTLKSIWFWGAFALQNTIPKFTNNGFVQMAGSYVCPMIAKVNPTQYNILATAHTFITSYFSKFKEKFNSDPALNFVIKYLEVLNKISECLKNINELCKNNEQLKNSTSDINKFLTEKNKHELELLSQFQSKNKQKEQTEFFKTMFTQNQNTIFINALKNVGQIDAYLSLTKLCKQKNKTYCIPNFDTTSKNLKIDFKEIFDPKYKKSKKFDVKINNAKADNKILTQKQQRNFAYAILLSHLGLAPATNACLTPIDYLETSIFNSKSIKRKINIIQDTVNQTNQTVNKNSKEIILITNKRLEKELQKTEHFGFKASYNALKNNLLSNTNNNLYCAFSA